MMFLSDDNTIRRSRAALGNVQFNRGRGLAFTFLTDPDFVRSILPPGLTPAEEPVMRCGVSIFAKGTCGPFQGASLRVQARHGSVEGTYVLAMWVDSEEAMLFGRELYGEPKVLADFTTDMDGAQKSAMVTRHGETLIDMRFTSCAPIAPIADANATNFNYRFTMQADGAGLQVAPTLVAAKTVSHLTGGNRGTGTLALGQSGSLASVPVIKMLDASYTEFETTMWAETLAEISAEAFLPFAFARMPDWGSLREA